MCKHTRTLCIHLAFNLACPVRFLSAKEPESILYSLLQVCEIMYQACLLVYHFPQCICKVLLLNTFCSINCSVKWGCEGIGRALQIFKHMTGKTLYSGTSPYTRWRSWGRQEELWFRVFRDWIQQQNTCSQILFPILIF